MKVEGGWAQCRPTGPFIPKCNAPVSACGNNLDSNLGSRHHLELEELGESLPDQTRCWSSTREFSKSLHVFDLSSKVRAFRTEGHELDQKIGVLLLNRQRHWAQFCLLSQISNMIILPGTLSGLHLHCSFCLWNRDFWKVREGPLASPPTPTPASHHLMVIWPHVENSVTFTSRSHGTAAGKKKAAPMTLGQSFHWSHRLWLVHVLSCDHALSPPTHPIT